MESFDAGTFSTIKLIWVTLGQSLSPNLGKERWDINRKKAQAEEIMVTISLGT